MAVATENLLEIATAAARVGGAWLARRPADWQAIDNDEGRDIKLAADRLCEGCLVEALAPSGLPVFSEESGWLGAPGEGLRWLIDPLDGTVNYARQVPLSAVSVALLDGVSPVLGVVYDFGRDELFAGAKGVIPATLNNRPMTVSDATAKARAVLATGLPMRRAYDDGAMLAFGRAVRQWKKVRMLGSAALSLAYVAAGRFDAYWEQAIMPWDVAAGWALVEAAGGTVAAQITDLTRPIDIFAAPPGLIKGAPGLTHKDAP